MAQVIDSEEGVWGGGLRKKVPTPSEKEELFWQASPHGAGGGFAGVLVQFEEKEKDAGVVTLI